jgi:ATP-binding cassette subfamily F protein 3
VEKKVRVLSGGERARLALVKLLLEPTNLLVLDEPTNHLDMRSKDILKQALIKYDGTLIVVSHDRDFLDGIVGKVYEFKHNKLKENIGGIYDFLRKKKIENLKDIERKDKIKNESAAENVSSNKQKYLEKKEYERNLRKLRRRLEESETVIEKIEAEIIAVDKSFMEPGNSSEAHEIDYKKYQDLKETLSEEMNRWTQYSQEVEEFLQNND